VLRTYFPLLQQAHQAVALVAGSQPNNSEKYDNVKSLTEEELERIIFAGLEKEKQEGGKGHVSSTD
jgi:hypothetical protein